MRLLTAVLTSILFVSCYPGREANGSEHPKSQVLIRILSKKTKIHSSTDCTIVKP